MHKKMNKNQARMMAMDVLYSQGLDILSVADVMSRLDKQKSIRLYTKDYAKSLCWNCDHEIGRREVVDGCLVAVKNSSGEVEFGVSSIHPKDLDIAPSKQVTGMIAAVKAELSPCVDIPQKFARGMRLDIGGIGEYGRFLRRCFDYFKVSSISFSLSNGHGVSDFHFQKDKKTGEIYMSYKDGVCFPSPSQILEDGKVKKTVKKTKKSTALVLEKYPKNVVDKVNQDLSTYVSELKDKMKKLDVPKNVKKSNVKKSNVKKDKIK